MYYGEGGGSSREVVRVRTIVGIGAVHVTEYGEGHCEYYLQVPVQGGEPLGTPPWLLFSHENAFRRFQWNDCLSLLSLLFIKKNVSPRKIFSSRKQQNDFGDDYSVIKPDIETLVLHFF